MSAPCVLLAIHRNRQTIITQSNCGNRNFPANLDPISGHVYHNNWRELAMNNHLISQKLLAHARNLHGGGNLYRVRSYRRAAMVIDGLDRSVADMITHNGRAALARLPGI